MRHAPRPLLSLMAAILALLPVAGVGSAPSSAAKPRLLALPWIVVDSTTNRAYDTSSRQLSSVDAEARRLAQSARAALDATMHRDAMIAMIPRREWEPHWRQFRPDQIMWDGTGCAACAPAGDLLRFGRDVVQSLARAVDADYVWLGITVLPLTWAGAEGRPDDCCRETLAYPRKDVLARSSVVLVRARDGEIVWQRDARRLDRAVPHRTYRSQPPEPAIPPPHRDRSTPRRPRTVTAVPVLLSAAERREIAVDDTARMLGRAFLRVHRQLLEQ